MRFTLRVSEKRPLKVFKVDKTFQTKSEVTKRTVEVAEAFGLGVDEEKTFTVFKDFQIDANPGDVVYITGESGSGKSVLLRDLADQMEPCGEFGGVVREQDLGIDPEGVLIESVGRDTNEAIETLSLAGLNEAFLFLRRYRELSDGQKYRFKVAKMLDSGRGTWVTDEFCATLDRITAKVVAYCVQKVARRQWRTLLVATTHEDLLEDLNPSIHISKRFGHDVSVDVRLYQPRECSLLREVEIKEASRREFQTIEHFHYKGALPQLTLKIFAAYIHGELAGAIAYSPPYFSCRGRSIALPSYKTHRMTSESMRRVNQDFTRISRVIVIPKYRSIGLGVKLVKETLHRVNKPYVETLAVMARYNPFFEKAGMVKIDTPRSQDELAYEQALGRLEGMGFNLDLLGSKAYNRSVISTLKPKQLEELRSILLKHFFARKFHEDKRLQAAIERGDKEAMAEGLKHRRLKPIYLIWKNPSSKDRPEILRFFTHSH